MSDLVSNNAVRAPPESLPARQGPLARFGLSSGSAPLHARHDQDAGRTGEDARRRAPGGRGARHDRGARRARRDAPKSSTGSATTTSSTCSEAIPAQPQLPRLPEDHLHLGQPRGLPRHPERQAAESRRHRQHRRHGDQGRLPRRHQPHVLRRQDPPSMPSGSPRSASRPCGAASRQCSPGAQLGDIGHAIQTFVEEQQLLGRARVLRPRHRPHLSRGSAGAALRRAAARGSSSMPGMTITVEPMVNAGKRHVRLLPDGWTVVTKDHSLSAQWEHTVLVTRQRCTRC